MSGEVRVKCGICGRSAAAEEFVLDFDYKKMACPLCIRDKKMKEKIKQAAPDPEAIQDAIHSEKQRSAIRPIDYDKDDEYLERVYKDKIKSAVSVENIDGERVKYRCPRCKYLFIYNTIKNMPANCPYCTSSIVRIRL